MKMSPEEKMNEYAAEIQRVIDAAKAFANKNDLMFEMGPAYGMGGSYYSPGYLKRDLAQHDNSTPYQSERYAIVNQHDGYVSLESGGWVSSSMEC